MTALNLLQNLVTPYEVYLLLKNASKCVYEMNSILQKKNAM
jgi:hypothetical protein